MFAEGDVVNDLGRTPFDPPEFQKYELFPSIETTPEGAFVYVERNPRGEIVSSEIINTNLSPTGDPAEAYKVQRKNQSLGMAKDLLVTGASLYGGTGLLRGIGSKIVEKIGPSIPKILGGKYSPIELTKKGGLAKPGVKGFQARNPDKLSSYKVGVNPVPATAIAVGGGFTALESAETTELDVQEKKLEIAEELSALENEPKDQKQIDVETQQDDVDFEIVKTEGETPKDVTVVDEEEETPKEAPQVRQQRLLDNPNFSRLIQNIGIGMIETGDIGGGIAQGSAQTSKDIMAFEDAVKEASLQPNEFNKWLTKEEIKNVNKFKEKEADYASALSEAMFEVDTSDAVLKAITDSRKLVATGDATGLMPLLGEYMNEAGRFFGADIELSTREAAKNFINDIINGNIKELTGESGRTISNLDRQIAKNLVGAIEWRSSKENVLDKLGKAYARSKSRYDSGMKNYQARLLPYEKRGITPPYQLGISNQDVSSENETQKKRVRLKIIN